MKTSSLERKDPDIFWLCVCLLVKVKFVYLFCALHAYHCASFTRECHGTTALQTQTTSIYGVICHR
jgi:hypothetical protein